MSGPDGVTIGQIGGPYAPFVANLNSPDACVTADFERWLREVRMQLPSPVAKPGPRARNSEFDGRTFGRWRDLKIVQFAELLAWRASLTPAERKKVTPTALGRWIGRNSSKDVNVTSAALKEALASLPALGAQVEHEMTQDETASCAIRGRIGKDISR